VSVVRAARTRVRGCRIVTTSLTARVLLANQLRATSDEVDWTVISGDAYDDPPDGVAVDVVPIRREFAPSNVRSFAGLLRALRRGRFAFAQTHTPMASFLGLPAARLTGTPAIYTMHGALYFADNTRQRNVLAWCFERWCCSWARRVLVQSREDEAALPRAHICPARKVTYLGNGIDIARFLEPVAPAAVGGDGDDRPVVVMVARLVREKGCHDFLTLAAKLAGRARFVHVGPVEHDQADALDPAEVAAAERDGTVEFAGAVDDVRPWLAAADVVVLPSYREGIPRVPMEASVMGRPVVGYDIRGMREVVDPDSGLLVPRGDVAALTEVVAGLLDQPERRAALGAAGAERVRRTFAEDALVDRLRVVYREMAREGR
jgi:glycosyltransferase involved in cell wall biosynthesis